MNAGFDRKNYWEQKILPWECARYGGSAWLKPNSWTLRRRMRQAEALARRILPAGGSVVELGCGSGLFAERLAGAYGTYLGIDLAETAIVEANARKISSAARFIQGDALKESLPDSDLAVALGLLDWLSPEEASSLLAKTPARFFIFSFTLDSPRASAWSPYGMYRSWYDNRFGKGVYRARAYSFSQIRDWLTPIRALRFEVQPAMCLDPGRLLLVERK